MMRDTLDVLLSSTESYMTSDTIIPAILPKDAQDLVDKVLELPNEVPIFHLDVLESDVWAPVSKDFEVHLMVDFPEEFVERWIDRGARRVVVHKLGGKVLEARSRVELGLAVEMHIPLEQVFGDIAQVDFVQIMSIAEIGEQGHPFDERAFDRIREVRNKFPQMPICVDGGVSAENYQILREMGVSRLIVGSHFKDLWNSLTKE